MTENNGSGASRSAWRANQIALMLSGGLAGCSAKSAPAIILFGAYFPDWLVFACISVAAALLTRIGCGVAGIVELVPFPLFTFMAAGILIAGVVDLFWLGR